MAEGSIILRKKLQELESVLADVFHLPMQPESSRHNQIIADKVHQRFNLLKNLLAAEVASQADDSSVADQLREMEEKLGELETAFRGWDDYRKKYVEMDHKSEWGCSDCGVTFVEDDDLERYGLEEYAAAAVKKEGGRNWRERGRCWGMFGSGIIMGAIVIVGLVSSHSSLVCHQYDAFFVPPT